MKFLVDVPPINLYTSGAKMVDLARELAKSHDVMLRHQLVEGDTADRVWICGRNPVEDLAPNCPVSKKVFVGGCPTMTSWINCRHQIKKELNQFDLIVAPSYYAKGLMLTVDVRVPVIVMPHGISEKFERMEITPRENRNYCLVASAAERKGLQFAAHVFENWGKGHLTILSNTGNIEGIARDLDNYQRTTVLKEAFPHDEMPDFYRMFDGLVSTSYSETFCNPVYEAMRMGLTVISARLPAVTEYLTENECYLIEMSDGYFFNANDSGHLLTRLPSHGRMVSILNHALESINYTAKIRKNGADFVAREISWAKWVKGVIEWLT